MYFRLFPIILFLALLFACTRENVHKKKEAIIEFKRNNFDFGELDYGSLGICEFIFANKGNEPLILSNVRTTCGCTVPEWTGNPVKEGETGVIRISYDTYRVGAFVKAITVYSNAGNSPVRLFIKGRVKPKE